MNSEALWVFDKQEYPADIEWNLMDERDLGRSQAAWYTNVFDPELVCTVKMKDKSVKIHRTGTMFIKCRDAEHNWMETIRYTDELVERNIMNDKDIENMLEFEHENNFDVEFLSAFYVGDIAYGIERKSQNYRHNLDEAIQLAVWMLIRSIPVA
jgi:hypothetical protein